MQRVAEELRARGKHPYVIPIGGSNPVGAIGYALAMFELEAQLRETGERVDRIVFATSSGGTQAGMVLGAKLTGFAGQTLAVSIDVEPKRQCLLP